MMRVALACMTALFSCAVSVHAETMPDPVELSIRMGTGPVWLTVYEPHLTVGDVHTEVRYEGYPMEEVLLILFGPDWQDAAEEIEFRALDGYVSRIPVARFQPGKAVLVYARGDGAPFTVDNLAQNQTDVPLGPYYLVWNNTFDEALLNEGAQNWPYQVNEISLSFGSDEAMRFDTPRPEFDEAIDLTKTHCISCHQVNGYGGNKHPANLASVAKVMTIDDFLARVLDPSSGQPDTTMPPLSPNLPEQERRRIAAAIHAYLSAMPVAE